VLNFYERKMLLAGAGFVCVRNTVGWVQRRRSEQSRVWFGVKMFL